MRRKRREAPEWVFQWRQPGSPALSKALAFLVTGGLFAVLLTTVRIRVSPPVRWAESKATVIHVPDDANGRALTLRASEGGPFPSRFLPSEWEESKVLEQAVMEAVSWTPPPYVPTLRELPEEKPPTTTLAPRGQPVLPKRQTSAPPAAAAVKLAPAPVLYPLSGIAAKDLPEELPPFTAEVDGVVAAETWRFLVRLGSAGQVRSCVSLAGGDEAGPSPLEPWLRRVKFKPDPGNPSRWIAVGVGLTNQPVPDGTDAR